ncbi:ABC transporter permease [Pontimonas sp.]|jgi:ribose transport system permease protein|nr:ABC transporter permease [Pontimonas sp.]MDA9114359.1 ABC transporter permease [Pontimonas sp.]MDA9117077.1 ABC transporter permease [Pontimonas sp.]
MKFITKRVRTTEFSLTVLFIVGFVALAATSGGVLLSGQSIRSFLTYLAIPILIGLAQMVVLAVGQLNLAVGAMGGASAAVMAQLMVLWDFPIWIALLAGFLVATLMGAVNGFLVVATGLNGFIITLGTLTILEGVQYALVRSFTIDGYPDAVKDFGKISFFNIPTVFMVAIATALVVSWFFRTNVIARKVLASGANPLAARLSGVSNPLSIFLAHTLSGALVGIAAIVTITSLGGINRSIGGDWLLSSFAAPIIGGVLMSGGIVAIYGTVMAASVIRLVDIARAQYSLDPSVVNFTIGTVVLSTVALSEWRRRRSEMRRQKFTEAQND